MVRLIADLSEDWRRLDDRIAIVSAEIGVRLRKMALGSSAIRRLDGRCGKTKGPEERGQNPSSFRCFYGEQLSSRQATFAAAADFLFGAPRAFDFGAGATAAWGGIS
jgi:hypothetical protein